MSNRRGVPRASSEVFRRRMEATKQRDTKLETTVRSLLHRRGLRFRVDQRPHAVVRGRADIVFRRLQIAVFLDGCFWHGCPVHATWPKANAEWWRNKIEANRARDQRVLQLLTTEGWAVLRYWEHEDPEAVAAAIEQAIEERRRRLRRPNSKRDVPAQSAVTARRRPRPRQG
jgi:DNA mismatch endonuclease, patch repair protein